MDTTTMTREQMELRLQQRLLDAQKAMADVARLADELSQSVQLCGLTYKPSFGWFDNSGELHESSEWNWSDCVIGADRGEASHPGIPGDYSSWNSSGCTE